MSARRWLPPLLAVVTAGSAAVAGGRIYFQWRNLERAIDAQLTVPVDVPPNLFDTWADRTPVPIVYTAAWQKFTTVVSRHLLQSDGTIWARMHFEDWDQLPPRERVPALDALLARHGAVIHAGACWPTMTPADWDAVPQPIRAVALLGVVEYWTRFYAVGEAHGHDIVSMVETVQAIVMSESWFDHRAVLVNRDGSRDNGMAGASAYARDVIRTWHARGLVDFALTNAEYFNPWHAARFAAFWFDLMLEEADGDVELAIRAYNRGISRARAGHGTAYQAAVLRRRRQFMQGASRSPMWASLLAWRESTRDTAVVECPGTRVTPDQRTISSPRISAQPDSARMLQ